MIPNATKIAHFLATLPNVNPLLRAAQRLIDAGELGGIALRQTLMLNDRAAAAA
jgi:hypothetical protein